MGFLFEKIFYLFPHITSALHSLSSDKEFPATTTKKYNLEVYCNSLS